MFEKPLLKFNTISEYHRYRELPPPEHPLISLVNFSDIQLIDNQSERFVFGFYSIALRRHSTHDVFKYGQQEYDHEEGIMLFMAPDQVFEIDTKEKPQGWLLLIHPDLFWNTTLASTIKKYDFFTYAANEALYLSPKEEECMIALLGIMQKEYNANIDSYSHKIIIAQLELLLSYSERYYNRQFVTRRISSHKIVTQLESFLNDYFESEKYIEKGIPSVQYVSLQLNISPKYLSDLLRSVTGKTTQQHIKSKLIEIAKIKLSTTNLSVSEIAYQLGFEQSQSFSKLFKSKTNFTPVQFRKSFN